MKIRAMRWGYDGGGVACGPVEGDTIVEICVTNNEGKNYWVSLSRMSEYEKVLVSPIPLFDILMNINYYGVDWEYELEKCTENAIEEYDYEIYEPDEKMQESEYVKVIQLVRYAMKEYYGNDNPETDDRAAREFIEEYLNKEIKDLMIPEVKYSEDTEE